MSVPVCSPNPEEVGGLGFSGTIQDGGEYVRAATHINNYRDPSRALQPGRKGAHRSVYSFSRPSTVMRPC